MVSLDLVLRETEDIVVNVPLIVALGALAIVVFFLLRKLFEQEQRQQENWEAIAHQLGLTLTHSNGLPHLSGRYSGYTTDLRVYAEGPTTIEISVKNPAHFRLYVTQRRRLSRCFAPSELEDIRLGVPEIDDRCLIKSNNPTFAKRILLLDEVRTGLMQMRLGNISVNESILSFENLDWVTVEKVVDIEYCLFMFNLLTRVAKEIDLL